MGTIKTLESISYTLPDPIVSLADRLDGTFVVEDYLRLERLRQTAAPEVSRAILSYEFSKTAREDKSGYATYPPLDITGKFCKVEIPTTAIIDDGNATASTFRGDKTLVSSDDYYNGMSVKFLTGPLKGTESEVTAYVGASRRFTASFGGVPDNRDKFVVVGDQNVRWWGIIEDDARDSFGTSPVASGNQQFTAYGLEWLLQKVVMDSAIIKYDTEEIRVGRALPFNVDKKKQFAVLGNRSSSQLLDHASLFGFSAAPAGGVDDLDEPEQWNAHTAMDYLLKSHVQTDVNGVEVYPWALIPPSGDRIFSGLTWYSVVVQTEGRTVRQVMGELTPRNRLVSYHVKYNDSTSKIEVHPFTFNETRITVEGAAPIPANGNQTTLDFDAALDVESAIVRNSTSHKYNIVIARGEWATSTFSVIFQDGLFDLTQMKPYWSGVREDDFNAGADPIQNDFDKPRRDRAFRGSEKMRSVYRQFRIATDWDMRVFDLDTNDQYFVAPSLDGNGDAIQPAGVEVGGEPLSFLRKRWLSWMPLKENHSYADSAIEDGVVAEAWTSFLRPFVAINTTPAEADPTYEFAHLLSQNFNSSTNARSWAVRVSVRDQLMVVDLDVTGGDQYFLAPEFDPETQVDSAHDRNGLGGLDWRDCIMTGTIELDSHVEKIAVISATPAGEVEDAKIVNVPGKRLDYVVPFTVVDVDDGGLVRTTTGGFVRDDRDDLDRIATMSAEWYSRDRQALTLTYKQLRVPVDEDDRRIQIGDLITTISTAHNKTDVNSVVTAIDMDVLAGETTIETQFAVADFA